MKANSYTLVLFSVGANSSMRGSLARSENPLRQNLFRAAHAHAGVLRVLSLVALRYVYEAELSAGWKQFVRSAIPSAAILLLAGFFFSVLSPKATEPSAIIYLAFVGAVVLAGGLITLGVGLLKKHKMAPW